MLVNESTHDLIGYLSATQAGAGFIVPLFVRRSSNMALVQEVGADSRIKRFREVTPRDFRQLEGIVQSVTIDSPALWGFRDSDGKAVIGEREVVKEFLKPRIESFNQPFLRLQVAQFCDNVSETVGAWRRAFDYLEERSPQSARAWRDVVIIPTQMRLAIEQAILANGLDASVDRLDRTVEVDVEDGRLRLMLNADLHAAFSAHAVARQALERSAAPIREAFRLPRGRVSLVSKQIETDAEQPSIGKHDDIAIAGFGDMAISLIGQLSPRIRRSVDRRTSHLFPAPRGLMEMVLLQRDELSGERDWGLPEPAPPLDRSNRILFVTFQLAASLPHLIDGAIAFAKKHRTKRRKLIAVIPHLPQEFEWPGEVATEIIPKLNATFEAVWALSDRSPYTRQALPYGPARSVLASATNFRYLLDLARAGELRGQLESSVTSRSRVNIVGSAAGDRSISDLTGHAMMRVRHHLLDLRTVASARVMSYGSDHPLDGVLQQVVRRDAPQADVIIHASRKHQPGPARVLVALNDVALEKGGPEEFERYCVEHLERFGWTIDQFEPHGPVRITGRGLQDVLADCKYIGQRSSSRALRARDRRRSSWDRILLTNGSIERRVFALHVLNGTVPLHSSRIEALSRIYRRRYAYALTYLLKERSTAERMLVPAAIDWLNLHHWIDSKNVSKVKLSSESIAKIDFAWRSISLMLPLEFTRHRGKGAGTFEGSANLLLDVDGWHLEALEADSLNLSGK